MALELVTGPANSEKAGYVLDGVRRAAAAAAAPPLLVVPTSSDVEAYRRELAGDGVALGVEVLDFSSLLREMARRTGVRERPLGTLARRRVAAAATESLLKAGRLRALATAADTKSFAAALADLCGEIALVRCDPRRFALAMKIWGESEDREAFAADLAALNGAYVARMEGLGALDPAQHSWLVLDALRLAPAKWGDTAVFLYGFDDLTDIELDAVRTLADHVGASVTVSLPFEARLAFAGRHRTWYDLSAIAGSRVVALPARDDHYAPASRDALHGLERGLLETDAKRVDPGGAIEMLAGGGPRAELELIAERVRRLLAAGTEPHDIAIALRDVDAAAALVEEVFGEAGVPIAHERRVQLDHTAIGRGLLALLRCALLDGSPVDLLIWLRSPGAPAGTGRRVDRLEAAIREHGLTDLAAALDRWEELGGHPLGAITRLREARARGELHATLGREALRMLAAPHRSDELGSAPVLGRAQETDAAAVRQLVRALDELADLERRDRRMAAGDRDLHDALATIEITSGSRTRPGSVVVADPLALRARRVKALLLGRLQEGTFPRPGQGEPFLGDQERRSIDFALAAAGQPALALRRHEDPLDAERYQLYAAVSRPTELLVLSWHAADEDDDPCVRSPFVDDVLDVLEPAPEVRERLLGSIGWDEADDVSDHQRALAEALRDGERRLRGRGGGRVLALHGSALSAALATREAWSPTELELYARCPVRWFVERLLRPGTIDPDAEPLSRGRAGHAALERTLRELAADGLHLDQGTLEHSIERLRVHLREVEANDPISSDPHRRMAECRRLEADLVRYLEHAVGVGSALRPSDFELSFGVSGAEHDAVDLGGLRVRGRIDRVDRSVDGKQAIIIDYKGRGEPKPSAKWLDERLLQAGLYALALERLEASAGTSVVGALYQPIGADPKKMRARGFVTDDADADAAYGDRISPSERGELLDAILDESRRVVEELRGGSLPARPDRCSWNDTGCAHPSICRCEA